jgi:predicted small lipoprotein YifL
VVINKPKSFIIVPTLLCIIALSVSGCGRRGPLETDATKNTSTPLSMNPSSTPQDKDSSQSLNLDGTKTTSSKSHGAQKPFPLDPLL